MCGWDAEAAFGGAHRFAGSAGLRPELPGAACPSGSDPSAAGRSRSPLCVAEKKEKQTQWDFNLGLEIVA